MDRLHRGLFRQLLSDDWPHGIETAIDITLLGRYYERFADHAVSVARRVVYLVTGERPRAGRRRRAGYFLPWFLTASMAAAAASGSRYWPPVFTGRRSSSRS